MSFFGDKKKSSITKPQSSATRRVLSRILEGTASFARSSNAELSVVHENIKSESSKGEADIERGQSQVDENEDDMIILRMIFEDTGTGIPEEQLERIFQPYAQAKLSDFRQHGGTGLGLSIISKLLQMMGGTVKVYSVVGEGSKFVITLPLRVPRQQNGDVGKSEFFTPPGTVETALEDISSRGYTNMGSDFLLEDTSNRNMLQPHSDTMDATPSGTSGLHEKTGSSDGNGIVAATDTPGLPQAPSVGLEDSTNPSQAGGSSATPDPSVSSPAPLFGTSADAPSKPASTTAAPLFGGNTVTQQPIAVQPAPLFGAVSPPSKSTSSSGAADGSGSTLARLAPQPPVSAPPVTKVRQLPQFHFEKNNNLVLVTDDNAVCKPEVVCVCVCVFLLSSRRMFPAGA